MSTTTTARISSFEVSAGAMRRILAAARDLAVDLSDVSRWETLASRDDLLARAVADARLRAQPASLALEAAIRTSPVLDRVSAQVARAQRQAAGAALEEARGLEARGLEAAARRAYARAEGALEEAIAQANRVLVPLEVDVTRDVLVDVLRELGYDDLRVSRAGDLRARRTADGKLVYARIDPRGALEVGLAGHDGATCQPHTAEIFEALRRRGIHVGERRTEVHGCRSGGRVARAAEERARARGIVSPRGAAEREKRAKPSGRDDVRPRVPRTRVRRRI